MELSGLVPVRVRDCSCPATPHEDGDLVYLLPSLSLEGGAAAEFDLMQTQEITDEQRRTFALLARWTATFVRYGAVAWNFLTVDERGRHEPVPFDAEILVADYRISRLVAGKANELYSEAVTAPLLEAAAAANPSPPKKPSRRGQTGRSTSPRPASISEPPESSSDEPSDGPALRIAR